ncbi:MAG: sensor histidine kinase, partial [Luteibaculum sp.]
NEIVGKSFVAFTHPDDLESSNTCLQNLASGKIKTAELEKRYIHKNGDYVEVQILANVLFDKKGKTDRIVSQIQDITKKKRKEQAMIMESEKQLNTIKKLQLKNTQLEDFGHIVSHNLRTPAGNIKMLLDLMLVSKTEEEQKQWVDALVDSSNNLIDTLDDLLELIRYTNEGNLKFEKLSIEETLRDILTEMSEHIKEVNPEIIVNFEKLPSISYPKIYLHSILSNLITNAIKYRDEDRPLKITLSSGINEDGLEYLNVADNGIGIDLKRFGNQLFQLNRTFTKRKDSTGFGLFMVKRQLEVLGGCISCKSEPDKGAEFTVILKSK